MPRDHPDSPAGPKTSLHWRDSSAITDVIAEIPVTPAYHGHYMLGPCVLHPEPGVVEYPSDEDLIPGGWERFDELEEQLGFRADITLFEAPGTKVGGWPKYCQGPYWPDCADCGQRLEYMLTIDDGESRGRSPESEDHDFERVRWAPISSNDGETLRSKNLGSGRIQLFYCPRCPGLPHTQYYDR